MIFQIVHTHTNVTCPGQSAEQAKRFGEWWQSVKKNTGLKILAAYASSMDHTFYITVEADDYPTVVKAFGALNTYGSGHMSPVLPLDQTLPWAEAGVFRASK